MNSCILCCGVAKNGAKMHNDATFLYMLHNNPKMFTKMQLQFIVVLSKTKNNHRREKRV